MKAVIQLFRDVERKVVGTETGEIRRGAKERSRLARTHQLSLGLPPSQESTPYTSLRAQGLAEMRTRIPKVLARHGTMRFDALWPMLLEVCHLTLTDVKRELWKMKQRDTILVGGVTLGDRTLKSHHTLGLPVA
jgi:hypothetical protein